MFKNILRRMRGTSTKNLVIASAFVVALAGAVSLGLATKQKTQAATVRECTTNSIDYKNHNGGCGAATTAEYIADLRTNDPSDLQTIAKNFTSSFHLDPSEYNDFAANAKQGLAYKDGRVVVDGQTVLTNAWSIGRHTKSYSHTMNIPGAGTFHVSRSQDVFSVNTIPVMVYFAKDGTVQFIAMNPCGNLMGGDKVTPKATCDQLNSVQDKTNPNKYTFTSNASFSGNASLDHVEYTFTDTGEKVTKTSLTAPVEHTFTKSGTVTVKVFAKVPGGHVIEVTAAKCAKQVTVVQPIAACTALVATALDDQKRKFRFTTKIQTKLAEVTSVKYALDQEAGVEVPKDSTGNYSKDYAFNDEKTHTVVATVTFTTILGPKTATCKASVTPSALPKCEVPGKENLPPDSPECAYCEVPGHETLPKDSPECKPETPPTPPTTPPELPKTGAGSVVGIFAGTSALGAAAHAVLSRRRKS